MDQVGVPKTIVSEAVKKKRALRKGKGDWAIYVLFDRDEHPHFKASVQQARDHGFILGVSVPCIELWGILLYQDQTAAIDRHTAQRLLKEIGHGYDHRRHPRVNEEDLLTYFDAARRRAGALLRRAQDTGDEFSNPMTTFPDVIEAITPS